ncbi:conserved hypothetical protein [Sporisorium reilianum SRZ2]|uniref:Uncharacterized protein n=1 Tax=Sporisorium reilianum (strain SRZ2) TaxID=999809 RepID=E6ZKJ8_SPORE|nr:conserved hypothetical protein [Sporisorium reilianum SRZ2]
MERPAPQRGSSTSSVSSMGSVDHIAFTFKDTHNPDGLSSQDTIYSCASADIDMASPSVDSQDKAISSRTKESVAALSPALSTVPPPRPSRHLRPPLEQCTVESATASERRWPLRPYCYDPFAEFDDSSLPLEVADSTRADSIEIDPGMLHLRDRHNGNSVAPPTIVEEEPLSCLTTPCRSGFTITPKRQAFDLPGFSPDPEACQRPPTSLHEALMATVPPTTSLASAASGTGCTDGRQAKHGKRALGVGSIEARAIIGLSIKKLSAKRSSRSGGATRAATQDKENQKLSTKALHHSASVPGIAIIGRESSHTEAAVHLELPAYHRGLRKQVYPPRVRYTEHPNSSWSSLSDPSLHLRCSSGEHGRAYAPRAAFDHTRTSTLR